MTWLKTQRGINRADPKVEETKARTLDFKYFRPILRITPSTQWIPPKF